MSDAGTANRRSFDLPESFDEWPRDDQLEYLIHTGKKRMIIQSVVDTIDADVNVEGAPPTLKKKEWAEIAVSVMEMVDSE